MRQAIIFVGLLFGMGLFSGSSYAQVSLTPFEQTAVEAFNPNSKTFSSISMTGDVVWTAGSLSESGTITFQIVSNGSFTETWNLPTQSHTFQSTIQSGVRTCTYTGPTGKQVVANDLSCFQAVPWFAPWFGLSSMINNLAVVVDTTQPSDVADGKERLSFCPNITAPEEVTTQGQSDGMFQRGTRVNVSYDLKTSLPSSLRFDQLIDSNEAHTIHNDASFADYRPESGYMIPHHIQRFIQRTLQADITITSVTVE